MRSRERWMSREKLENTDLLHRTLEGEELTPLERESVRQAIQHPKTGPDITARMREWRSAMQSLESLPRAEAPPGFADALSRQIAVEAALERVAHRSILPPPDFATQLAARISEDAHPEVAAAFSRLPRLQAPAHIAATLSARIARESRGLEEHNPAPLYLVGGVLLAAGVGVASYAWPFVQSGGGVLLELVRSLPPTALLMYSLLLVLSLGFFWLTRATEGRIVRPMWQFGGALSFALVLALSLPGLSGYFGSALLESGKTTSSLFRVGGNITVSGAVTGNVTALGGNVILEPGAEVRGQVISVLGNVKLPADDSSLLETGHVTAVLGQVQGASLSATPRDLPSVGAAAAFQPLLELSRSEQWPLLHLGLLATFALLLFQSGGMGALSNTLRREGLRALSSGMLLLGLGLPLLLLLSLSKVSSGLAMIGLVLLASLMSAGLALTLSRLGMGLSWLGSKSGRDLSSRLEGIPLAREGFQVALGLGLFALTLPFPLVATLVWAIGGALGLGTLVMYLLGRARGVEA